MELLTGKSEKQLVNLKPADVYSPEAAEKVIETDEKVFRHNVRSPTNSGWTTRTGAKPALKFVKCRTMTA